LALSGLRRGALIGTIFAGHVVELHLLQYNIFDRAKFRARSDFDRSERIAHGVLKFVRNAAHEIHAHHTQNDLLGFAKREQLGGFRAAKEELMERANGRARCRFSEAREG
jgi:hypothetical protein